MIIHEVEQGTPRWAELRAGIATCSAADRILTPKKLELSSQARPYMHQLLTERYLGHPVDWSGQSGFTERGTGMEAEARAYYELVTGAPVTRVGFITRDDGMFGGSPDSLVGDRGILELKCPALHTFIGYAIAPDTLVADYRGQCQALLYVAERDWVDLMAYHPELPAVLRRVKRDEAYIEALANALDVFQGDLDAAWEKLQVLSAA